MRGLRQSQLGEEAPACSWIANNDGSRESATTRYRLRFVDVVVDCSTVASQVHRPSVLVLGVKCLVIVVIWRTLAVPCAQSYCADCLSRRQQPASAEAANRDAFPARGITSKLYAPLEQQPDTRLVKLAAKLKLNPLGRSLPARSERGRGILV